jgi:hypothetical protein
LRSHGIDVFVPHESFLPNIKTDAAESLVERGLLTPSDLEGPHLARRLDELMWDGKVSREELGLPELTPELIFQMDYKGLSQANAVVALLDGTQVDDGTACEIGIFYGLLREDPTKKGVIGLMTDFRGVFRADHGYGTNLFVWGVIEECGLMVSNFDEVIAQLKAWDRP